MENTKDPLASLFTDDAKATNREQLASLVVPFIKLVKDSKEFEFLPAFSKLKDNPSKIEILLAAVKARALFLNEPDGLAPSEIIATQILPEGSVKSAVKGLFDGHKIKKDKDGKKYILPPYRIPELTEKFINAKP